MEGSDGLTALLEAAAPEHLSLELNTGWWAAVGRDPVAGLHAWGRRVRRLHLKDLVLGQIPPWVDVGDGVLDVARVLAAARAHGVPWAIVGTDPRNRHRTSLGEVLGSRGLAQRCSSRCRRNRPGASVTAASWERCANT